MQIDYTLAPSTAEPATRLSRFAVYAWGTVAYNLLVILWGAYVRATGSGAGCGSHWPLCNGEVVPRAPQLQTIIEFTHRLSSGLALLAVIGLVYMAFRTYPRKHLVRMGATLSALFILTEALIGAGLVLLRLVADNASIARAFYLSFHLVNTFVLLAVLTLTAWWASGRETLYLKGKRVFVILFAAGLFVTLILGISGAITALGDTLFPANSLQQGLQQDNLTSAHIFIRLRILHPVIAIAVGIFLIIQALRIISAGFDAVTKRIAMALIAIVLAQLAFGAVNVYLLAPIWMQLIHLLLADLLWITLILMAAAVFNQKDIKNPL
jgi:heme A synthase